MVGAAQGCGEAESMGMLVRRREWCGGAGEMRARKRKRVWRGWGVWSLVCTTDGAVTA